MLAIACRSNFNDVSPALEVRSFVFLLVGTCTKPWDEGHLILVLLLQMFDLILESPWFMFSPTKK